MSRIYRHHTLSLLPRVSRVAIVMAVIVSLVFVQFTPAQAQEVPVSKPLLERLHEARAETNTGSTDEFVPTDQVSIILPRETTATFELPPLPFDAPSVGPDVEALALDQSNVSPALDVVNVTGTAVGQHPRGYGMDFIANADDMDMRSTSFDVAEIAESDSFEMPADLGPTERWIRVDLGNQQVVAYEGETPVNAFVVSTGLPGTPTVTGEFRIRMKVSSQTMSGGGSGPGTAGYYNLPDVRWVMYFYDEYALHGSYWHSDFGIPKSHGCVNMTNADSKWIFDWTGPVWDGETVWYRSTEENPGTRVVVH